MSGRAGCIGGTEGRARGPRHEEDPAGGWEPGEAVEPEERAAHALDRWARHFVNLGLLFILAVAALIGLGVAAAVAYEVAGIGWDWVR